MENRHIAILVLVSVIIGWKYLKVAITFASVLFFMYCATQYEELLNLFVLEDAPMEESIEQETMKKFENVAPVKQHSESDISNTQQQHFNKKPHVRTLELLPVSEKKTKVAPPASRWEQMSNEPDECNRLVFKGNRFALVDGVYGTPQEAENRIVTLKRNGVVKTQIIWLPCYGHETKTESFAIILGKICQNEADIEEVSQKYVMKLYSADIARQTPKVLLLQGMEVEIDL